MMTVVVGRRWYLNNDIVKVKYRAIVTLTTPDVGRCNSGLEIIGHPAATIVESSSPS